MIKALIPITVTWVYLWLSVLFARREYRRVYGKLRTEQVPALYGRGWMTPENKRSRALQAAYTMLAFWPVILMSRLPEKLVSTPGRGRVDPYALDVLEAETEKLRPVDEPVAPEPVPQPCPCGYLTECPVHCGDGSMCHASAEAEEHVPFGSRKPLLGGVTFADATDSLRRFGMAGRRPKLDMRVMLRCMGCSDTNTWQMVGTLDEPMFPSEANRRCPRCKVSTYEQLGDARGYPWEPAPKPSSVLEK